MKHDPNIVISDEVLAKIAVTAAKEVDGVAKLVPLPLDLARLPKKKNDLRFVKITQNQAAELTVALALRLHAAAQVTAVAGRVQRAVKDALESMTERTIARVNVRIQGVD